MCAINKPVLVLEYKLQGRANFMIHGFFNNILQFQACWDLYFVCEQNNLGIQQAACLSDGEKSARCGTKAPRQAKTDREYYNVHTSKRSTGTIYVYKDSVKCQSKPFQMHYSFDFA